MKLLLITDSKRGTDYLEERHLEQIKQTAPDLQIVAMTNANAGLDLDEFDIIVGFPGFMPTIVNSKNLKWIHSFSAGVDKVLTPEIINSSVLVSNSAGIHATPIAEHVLGFLLLCTRQFLPALKSQIQHQWKGPEDVTELRSKTILIVGLGHIGEEVARLVSAFGATVIATVRNLRTEKPEQVSRLETSDHLTELLPEADFVVITAPLTTENRGLFNKEKFQKMKPTAVIINIGRGPIINEADLIETLKNKTIAGAALDVTETEPLPHNSPLWDMENVFITAHYSGLSERYMERAIDRFCMNLKAFLEGKELPNLVDKRLGY